MSSIFGRKSMSKVNQLRALNTELTDKVNYHSTVSARVLNWVHKNCTEEQKEEFTKYIKELCNELASK